MENARAGRTAIVVGGGLAGLAAAVGLHRTGWQVEVVERTGCLGEVGAGVALGGEAMRALETLGVGDAVVDAGQVEELRVARVPSGRGLSRIGATTLAAQLGAPTLGVHRVTLHRILRQALPRNALRAGTELVAVRPGDPAEQAEVDLRHAGHRQVSRVDLVVVADGRHSPTRALLWPDLAGPRAIGSTVWRGVTSHPSRGATAASISWGSDRAFVAFPLGGARISWYGTAVCAPGGQELDELAAARRLFGAWPEPVPALLTATEPHQVLRDDLCRLPAALPSYVVGRVALVGDAAHADRPDVGQGAGLALADAVALSAHCGDGELTAALRRYDRERRPGSRSVPPPAPPRVALRSLGRPCTERSAALAPA